MKRSMLFIVLALLSAVPALAGPTVDEIVNRANLAAYYAGDDGKARVDMTITDAQGRKRSREFVILRRDDKDGGDQKFYVYFNKPSDVRKMVFMVHKHVDRDDDRWLYLPALSLVKRIAASDKRTSFVGSNFFYEDVSGRSPDEDTHELTEETDSLYILKNIPKDPESVEFSNYTVEIDKKTFMPLKAEYFDKSGKKYRVVEALEIKEIQGHPTVTKSKVEDLAGGGETVSVFSDIRYDIGLSDNIFTERYLHRPPREVR
jgi:outer membrane lipoprotein-sorting protein